MGQALAVPMEGGGLPAGTAVVQPRFAGEANVPVVAVKIGAEKPAYEEQLAQIAGRLATLAGEQVRMKAETEEDWIAAVRAYHGYYDSDSEKRLKLAGTSRAYVKLTRAKTVALEARLFDLIFPTDDRNWGIEATPVPKLSKEGREAQKLAQQAAEKANDAEAQNDPATAAQHVAMGQDQAGRAMAASQTIEQIAKASDMMQEEMDDQLVESQYPAESRLMIHDACLLGTGILKGPMVNESTRGRWLRNQETGEYALERQQEARPMVRRVDPWSFFPDMSARSIEEAEFTFERYLWTAKDLRSMVASHGFNKDAVREILREKRGKAPVATGLTYLTQLRSITGTGDGSLKGRFIGWEYHGPLECEEVVTILRAMGEEEAADEYALRDDPLEEFRVVLYFCEGQILKLAPEYPLDSGETLYSVFNIERSEGSIFGYGIPHIMADSATALNSAWRMGLDNAALSVGPQAIFDKTAVEPADKSWTIVPRKVWHRIKAATPNTSPPVEFFNVPNNMAEIQKIIEIALQFIDMETGIPMPQQGDQTADQTKTVGGMTILQNAANVIFRRMVKNYDDGIIAPTMRRLYDWNMQFNPREEIKGDMQVDARGTAVLLLKEVQAQNLMFIVTQLMNAPSVQPMIKPYQNVQKLFQSMMIKPSDVMVSEDEWKANLKKLAEQPPPPDPAQIQAEARIKAAQINADASNTRSSGALEIAQLRERTAMLELAQEQGLTLEQLRTELEKVDKKLASDERIKAVEIATEDVRAREAVADGLPAVRGTGEGIG
jgi:hypothetical protein